MWRTARTRPTGAKGIVKGSARAPRVQGWYPRGYRGPWHRHGENTHADTPRRPKGCTVPGVVSCCHVSGSASGALIIMDRMIGNRSLVVLRTTVCLVGAQQAWHLYRTTKFQFHCYDYFCYDYYCYDYYCYSFMSFIHSFHFHCYGYYCYERPCAITHRIKKDLSLCQSLQCLDLVTPVSLLAQLANRQTDRQTDRQTGGIAPVRSGSQAAEAQDGNTTSAASACSCARNHSYSPYFHYYDHRHYSH